MGSVFSIAEVQANGSDTNSGFFDPNASFTQTLSATNANTASPVVTASNYTFVSNDVGNYLFVKNSGVWNCGWYRIVSVNAGAATIDASVGNVFTGDQQINTFLGVATTSTASSGYWGIDYTQKNTSFISYTDLSIVTVQYGLQSTANPFTPNLIGNTILISSGTNFSTGLYIINSLSGSSAYMDRNVGTVGSTGGVGVLGGALATAGRATSLGFSYHYVYMKGSSGTFNLSSNPYSLSGVHTIIGYLNKRGDNLKATIKISAESVPFLTSGDGKFVSLYNLIIDGQSFASTRALLLGNNQISYFYNCEFKNLSQALWSACHFVYYCYFENCASIIQSGNGHMLQNNIFKNCGGTVSGSPYVVERNIFYNHSSNPIRISSTTRSISNNTFYNITGNAIDFYSNYGLQNQHHPIIVNNIFSNVSLYAVNYSNSGSLSSHVVRNNAYFACGGTHFIGQGNSPGTGYYLDTSNVVLTNSPFVSASTGDFRLNNTINGGRSCRGASHSIFNSYLGISSALDIGAIQSTSNSPEKVIGSFTKAVDIKENTTSYTEYVYLASTGYSSNTEGLQAYYLRQNGTPIRISLTSQSVNGSYISGGFVEVDSVNLPGLYRIDLPNAIFASGVKNAILHVANLTNNDKTIINYKFLDSQILDLSTAVPTSNTDQTVGDALNAARAYGFGKWVINGNWLNYYDNDGITIIKSLYLDNPNYPKSRGYGETTSGLILNLKAYEVNSYPGSGNLWNDLSGSNYHCSLYYNPTYVLDAGGSIQFNGSQVGICELGSNITFTQYTYNVWVKITQNSAQWQSFININNDNFLLGISNLIINSYNPTFATNYTIPLNTWVNICQTYVQGTPSTIYVNGTLVTTSITYNLSYTGQRISIGAGVVNPVGPVADEFLYGRISEIQMFNRRLTDVEIYNNYISKKSRYGL